MSTTTSRPQPKRIEIAYSIFPSRGDGRMQSKRTTCTERQLAKKLAELAERGAFDVMTRDAE